MAAETIKELQAKIASLKEKITKLEAKGDSKAAQNKRDKLKAFEVTLQVKQAKKTAETAKKEATTKDEKRAIEEAKDKQIAELKGELTKEEAKQFKKQQAKRQEDADFAGIDFDKDIIGGTSVTDVFQGAVDFGRGYIEAYADPLTYILGPTVGPIFGGLSAVGATPGGDGAAGLGLGDPEEELAEDLEALIEEQERESLLDTRLKAIDFRSLYQAEGRAATRRGSKSKRRERPGQVPELPQIAGTEFVSPTTVTGAPAQIAGGGGIVTALSTPTNGVGDIVSGVSSSALFGQ